MLRSRPAKYRSRSSGIDSIENDEYSSLNAISDPHYCCCGLSFQNMITKDVYQLDMELVVNKLFDNGVTLYHLKLIELGVRDLNISTWTNTGTTLKRSLSYNNQVKKLFGISSRFCQESQTLTKAIFESKMMITEKYYGRFECFHRITFHGNSCGECMVQSWYHVHPLPDTRHGKDAVRFMNDWFVSLHTGFQFQLKQVAQTIHTGLDSHRHVDHVRGPREYSGKITKMASSETDIVDENLKRNVSNSSTFVNGNESPELPTRTSTKKIKVESESRIEMDKKPCAPVILGDSPMESSGVPKLVFNNNSVTSTNRTSKLNSKVHQTSNAFIQKVKEMTKPKPAVFAHAPILDKIHDIYPPVHLPGHYPVTKMVCNCSFSNHQLCGVTGFTTLYFLLHIWLIILITTGYQPFFYYK